MTQEVRLFARMAAFGLIVGAGYWFLTYETTGTVLLLAFGLAAGIAAIAVFVGGWAGRGRGGASKAVAKPSATSSAGARALTVEPVPRPGWAPLGLAIGLGATALGGAFGPFPAIGGIVIAVVSARAWLGSAMGETDEARERETDEAREREADSRPTDEVSAQPERVVSRPRS